MQRDTAARCSDDLRDTAAHLAGADDENVLELHDDAGYRRGVPHLDVNGARLWVEEAGNGPSVLFIHGGLGDLRLWEPQTRALADRFRCLRFDLRFYGRSESPGIEFSAVEDVVGVLDALGVERVALVGHDPPELKEIDAQVAHTVPGARLVEVDSDHYLTLREPELVSELLREFLSGAADR